MKLVESRHKTYAKVLSFVRETRLRQKRVGSDKLHHMLLDTKDPDLVIGRDRLNELLRTYGLLVNQKRAFVKTTDYKHNFKIYPNLLAGFKPTGINQAWVVDITYLNTCDGFVYLFLVTDLYSRKIISYKVAPNMNAEHACQVLLQALKTVTDPTNIIHHSDHGSQYCSIMYQNILSSNKLRCSMTGSARCYDNAVAERVNGILKHEHGLNMTFPNRKVAEEATKDAVYIYNNERLHRALKMRTPEAVYANAA